MKNIPLSEQLKAGFYEFLDTDDRINSKNTLKSYKFIAEKVFENYEDLSKESTRAMINRYGNSTNVKAMLKKLNEFFLEYDIDYNIRFRKGKRKVQKIPDILSKEQLKEILGKMPTLYSMIVSCIYNIGAGLRVSELIGLEWDDIRWEQLTLEEPVVEVLIKNTKGGKSRVVPMAKESAIRLLEYAGECGVIGSLGVPEGGKIFDFGSDSYLKDLKLLDKEEWEFRYVKHSYDWIRYNIFKKYFKVNGKNITPHSLRHSRATELLNEHNVTIEKIKDWLGHEDISTTMIYLRMSSKGDKELMLKIGGV